MHGRRTECHCPVVQRGVDALADAGGDAAGGLGVALAGGKGLSSGPACHDASVKALLDGIGLNFLADGQEARRIVVEAIADRRLTVIQTYILRDELDQISSRWDTPDTLRQQRGGFGAVLLSCLTIMVAAVVSLVLQNSYLVLYLTGPFLSFSLIPTYRHLTHHPASAPQPVPAWLGSQR